MGGQHERARVGRCSAHRWLAGANWSPSCEADSRSWRRAGTAPGEGSPAPEQPPRGCPAWEWSSRRRAMNERGRAAFPRGSAPAPGPLRVARAARLREWGPGLCERGRLWGAARRLGGWAGALRVSGGFARGQRGREPSPSERDSGLRPGVYEGRLTRTAGATADRRREMCRSGWGVPGPSICTCRLSATRNPTRV